MSMMRRIGVAWIALLAVMANSGCDQAKSLVGGKAGTPGRTVALPGGKISPELESQIERDATGVRFRRDLVFPSSVSSWMQMTVDYDDVKVIESSAFGREVRTLKHKKVTEVLYRKRPGQLELTLERMGVQQGAEEVADGEAAPAQPGSALVGKGIEFALYEKGWGLRRGAGPIEFEKEVWADTLEDRVPQILICCGAHPRVQWFSSRRSWKPGDRITLTGSNLKILDPFDVSGRVVLVFEGVESVGGHPCGVFSVSGEYETRGKVSPDGWRSNVEVSVTSGRIWASLLHPVVLAEDLDTILSEVSWQGKKKAEPIRKYQGRVKVKTSLNWQPEE